MKNFTNSFKQFTSRLSARWLIMALMMLVGTSSAWADRVYYVNINKWTSVYCYAWKDGGSNEAGWPGTSITSNKCSFKVNGYDVYYYDTNGTSDMCIFNNNSSQSSDLTIANGPYFYGNTARASVKDIYDNDAWMFYINQDYNTNALCIHNGSSYISGTYVASKNYYISTSKSNINGKTINISNNCGSWTGTGGKTGGTTVGTTYVHPGCYYKTGNQGTSIVKAATLSSLSIASSISKTDASSVNVTAKATSSTSSYGNALKAQYFVDNIFVAESAQLSTSGTTTTLNLSSFSDGSHTLSVILTDGTISYPDAKTATFTIISCTTVETPNVTADAICAGSTATLTLNNRQEDVTYKLNSTTGTTIFTSGNNTYTTPALNANTTYKIYALHDDACEDDVKGSVDVIVNPTPAKPTFAASEQNTCAGTINLNTLFACNNLADGATLNWYNASTDALISDPANVSIAATTTYYAVAVKGDCSSEQSANVTAKINTPTISNVVIEEVSTTSIRVSATITGDDLALGLVEYVPDEKGMSWVFASSSRGAVGNDNTYSCIIDNLEEGQAYKIRVGANTRTCSETYTYSAEYSITTDCSPIDAPAIKTTATVCPNTSVTLSSYNNGVANVLWYTNSNCSQSASATVSIDAETRYYARVKNGNCYSETASLTLSVYEAPAAPDLSPSGKINVGQNKSATITVNNMDANATYVCKNASDQEVGTWNGNSVTFNVGDATGEFTYTIVATHGTCADLSTPTEFTVKVQEAGVKIAALGSTALYTNDPTHFIPMYVSNEDLAGVGATSVKNYTWQYSEDGTSEWTDCTRIYSNFNAANNQSNGNVVVTNGSINCNNWRANQVGYYRCKLTYDNEEEQVSGNIQVTEATNNKTNKQHIDITYNLPIISVNTGATDFPSDANLATISSNCGSSKYPSIHADDLKKKRSVDVMMFNPNGTICYDRKARMNYRGSSSLNFQKKSYAFCPGKEKCGDDEKGADYVKTNKENLFGLSDGAEDKDWVLYAATPDPSMMRNRLVFDLYKKMRPDDWGVNSMYVELVVNGEYRGVYVLMDKITNNANRVNIKNENGFIVKFDKTDVVDRVENTDGDQKTFATSRTGTKNSSNGNESYGTCIDQRFEIEYPEKEDIDLWDAFYGNVQQRFEDFETALANKDYATVRTLIDYDSWADWFILTELAKNQDGFRASCIFVYDGDKIEARPLWDQELSFNNGTRVKHGIADPEGLLITTSSVYDDAFYPPFWFIGHTDKNNSSTITGGLLNDPCFVSLVKQKWATYQSGVCSAASIGTMVAAYNTELGDAINREAARWPYTEADRGTTTDGDYIGYYSQGEGNPSQYSYAASKAAITAWASDRSTALDANSGLGKAINGLNGEALIFTISPSSVETTPWKQVLLTVNAPEGYEYTFDDSSINNATVRASVKKDNNTYAIKIPRPTAWGIGGNGDPDTQTQYQVSATIEVSGESECGTIQNGTATSTITLTDVTEDCNPEIVKP